MDEPITRLMSDNHFTSRLRQLFRGVWLLLAALDACVLIYLALSYRWFDWDMPQIATPAVIIVLGIVYGVIAFLTALAIAVVAAIGAGLSGGACPPESRAGE